jgi:hypothetical protein
VEPLNEPRGDAALASEGAPSGPFGEKVREGAIGSVLIDPREDLIDALPVLDTRKAALRAGAVIAANVVGEEPSLSEEPLGLPRLAVDELGAQLDGRRKAGIGARQDPAADPVPRLQQDDLPAAAREITGRRQAGRSGPYDDDLGPLHPTRSSLGARRRSRHGFRSWRALPENRASKISLAARACPSLFQCASIQK